MNDFKDDRLSSTRFIGEFDCKYCGATIAENTICRIVWAVIITLFLSFKQLIFVFCLDSQGNVNITHSVSSISRRKVNLISKIKIERMKQLTKFQEELNKIHISCYDYFIIKINQFTKYAYSLHFVYILCMFWVVNGITNKWWFATNRMSSFENRNGLTLYLIILIIILLFQNILHRHIKITCFQWMESFVSHSDGFFFCIS